MNVSDYAIIISINNEIIEPIIILCELLSDIVHLHIYPFILFVIIRNINSIFFPIFIHNICLIIATHVYFMIINTSYLVTINQTTIELRILNSIKYIFVLEFIGYWYHRLAHTATYYDRIHTHDYPSDYLLTTKHDIIARCIYTYTPLLIVPMTYTDFMIIYYFYIYFGFLSDTNMFMYIHRHTKKYNYSILFPIYDCLFGTYLSKDEFLLIHPNNSPEN